MREVTAHLGVHPGGSATAHVSRRTEGVGGDFPDAAATVRHLNDEVDDVRLLTEVLVPELVAARLWLEQPPT